MVGSVIGESMKLALVRIISCPNSDAVLVVFHEYVVKISCPFVSERVALP